ncbi:hypothetical protein [Halorussus caseinilyticus]|uniref:Uncharacterized protein n=1 Tax=Halorussus caseinilyticus TaxID=3034025 RepID=A0ABD5WMT6_9EURY|nr:hypothetical protein [Halorussus sp. DT72]
MARESNPTRVAWPKVYLVLTALSTGLLGLLRYDVPPFDRLPPVAAAVLIVAVFAAASVGHWYDVNRRERRAEDAPPDFPATLDEEIAYRETDEPDEKRDGDGRGDDDTTDET